MTTSDSDLSDAEFITPPDEWRKKVRVMGKREAAKFDPVKAAEQAIARLAQNFPSWMEAEAKTLAASHEIVLREGLTQETLDPLYQSTHNIKGQALTLGFPLVGAVAGNLCRLIETIPSVDEIPLPLLSKHVESIRAMVSENARDEANETGATLLATLRTVTDEVLANYPSLDEQG
ncbi:Hpt domain-containing protein [Roseibium sp. CAU 1637]|uniref:Hpt domain-containing protein n=1 Tax=Roseibium limicola TaxID=2816037 RepID=A0A939J8G9_9HYPH|nr:Hpt domain-containing protein [Roseibium limicola]MBO0344859.1 Hpt domain-containing protein [Roseibium limicola]